MTKGKAVAAFNKVRHSVALSIPRAFYLLADETDPCITRNIAVKASIAGYEVGEVRQIKVKGDNVRAVSVNSSKFPSCSM